MQLRAAPSKSLKSLPIDCGYRLRYDIINLSGAGNAPGKPRKYHTGTAARIPAGEHSMKIDRLYSITIYLLNHGRTSASKLAAHFEVSLRTIQRDMDSLCLAGIPVVSVPGVSGGYEISERFRLNHLLAAPQDYSHILTALRGLVSATHDRRAEETLEKVASLQKPEDGGIVLDFSVLREGDAATLGALQKAVKEKHPVCFTYTNNDGETRSHCVEPVALVYRWYAWYLLAYSTAREDYRLYKLVRMSDLKIRDLPFTREHEAASVILERNDRTDSRRYLSVLVKCRNAAKARAMEYLNGTLLEETAEGGCLMKLNVVENEQLWIGTLLSLGDDVEVIEPEEVRRRLLETAGKIISLYAKP